MENTPITVTTEQIKNIIDVVSKVNSKVKNPRVLIRVTGQDIQFNTATLESKFVANVSRETLQLSESDITFCLNPITLAITINQVNSETITFNIDEEYVNISAGTLNAQLLKINIKDNEALILADHLDVSVDTYSIPVNVKVLKRTLENIKAFPANEEYQAAFRSINIEHGEGDQLTFVGTDGFKLAYITVPRHKNEGDEEHQELTNTPLIDALLPAYQIPLITKMLSSIKEDTVNLQWDERGISFNSQDLDLCLSLSQDAFPAWRRIIPSSIVCSVVIDTKVLQSTIARVAALIMSDGTLPNKQINFSCVNKAITLSSISQSGNLQQVIEAEEQTGEEDFLVKFNAKNLLLGLKPLPDGLVTLQFSGVENPTLITHEAYPEYLSVVVPLRGSQ